MNPYDQNYIAKATHRQYEADFSVEAAKPDEKELNSQSETAPLTVTVDTETISWLSKLWRRVSPKPVPSQQTG